MGYESKLYIVKKSRYADADGRRYAQVIAMFDVCKYYSLSDVLRNKPVTDCYIYADDGNTEITKDEYGKPLTESDLQTVIYIIEKDIAEGENYRRIFPLLSMLKAFEEQKNNGIWDNIVVLHYGY